MGRHSDINGFELVGASLDTIRRGREPGVRNFAQDLPPVGATIELTIGELRSWHSEPWIWVDLTAPGHEHQEPGSAAQLGLNPGQLDARCRQYEISKEALVAEPEADHES